MTLALALALALALHGCAMNEAGNVAAVSMGDLSHGEPTRGDFDAALVEACGPGGPTAEGERHLLRLPYLQSVNGREASVLWTTEAREVGTVEIREAVAPPEEPATRVPALVDRSAPLPLGVQARARVAGLQPDTIYCYRVVSAGDPWTEWTGLRTAPANGKPVSFAVFGDLGEATADQLALFDQMKKVTPIDFVLVTGDVAYDSGRTRELERHFFAVYQSMLDRVPFFPVAGNHDYGTRNGAPFREAFALPENGGAAGRERWYSFDWGDVHVVALDTEQIGPEQVLWLDADLRANSAPFTVVYAHEPPYSSGSHGGSDAVREAFVPIFERHGVDLVFLGHDHHYERTQSIRGVTYIVTGGGGRGTRPVGASDFTAFAEEVIHFVYVTARDDALTAYAVDGAGKLFDSVVVAAPRP